jgi:hypothetical protein
MTKFQRLHRTYVLDCSAESFRELQGFLTNAVRNRETFRAGGDQASRDRIFDSFNAYRRATWQSENEVPADYTPSSSIPATPTSLCVKSGTPNLFGAGTLPASTLPAGTLPAETSRFCSLIARASHRDTTSVRPSPIKTPSAPTPPTRNQAMTQTTSPKSKSFLTCSSSTCKLRTKCCTWTSATSGSTATSWQSTSRRCTLT